LNLEPLILSEKTEGVAVAPEVGVEEGAVGARGQGLAEDVVDAAEKDADEDVVADSDEPEMSVRSSVRVDRTHALIP
jgi:hypothetical protein